MRGLFKFFGTIAPWPTWKFAAKIFFSPRSRKVREFEMTVLETGKTEKIFLDGKDVVLTSWGSGDKKVLLLHGWGGNRAQMTPFVEELLAQGLFVIAVDGPAHGESTGNQTNMAKIIEAVELVNEKFGGINYVVGHSFGGAALVVALDRGLDIEKIVTISMPTHANKIMKPFQTLLNVPDKVIRRIDQRIAKLMGQTFEEISAVNLAQKQTIPFLIIQDSQDSIITISDAIELNANWTGSELYLTNGFGHRQILRENSVHHKVAEFLTSNNRLDQS